MSKDQIEEVKHLLYQVQDEDLPAIKKPSPLRYLLRACIATMNMVAVTLISLIVANINPQVLYSIPIYAGVIAVSLYPLHRTQT